MSSLKVILVTKHITGVSVYTQWKFPLKSQINQERGTQVTGSLHIYVQEGRWDIIALHLTVIAYLVLLRYTDTNIRVFIHANIT